MRTIALFLILSACALGAQAASYASECEVGGQPVSTSNGATTAGKTGLMRCRDRDSGMPLRERELKDGVFMGVARDYEKGVLQRDYSVNERGNRDGLWREYAATPGDKNPLIAEETYRNGQRIGLARRWAPDGTLRRVAYAGDDGRDIASAEFNPRGHLTQLRCAPQAVLGRDADDATWCGHRGKAAPVTLYDNADRVRGNVLFDRGEQRRLEWLGDDGKPREQVESNADGGVERNYSDAGVKLREKRWVMQASGSDAKPRRVVTLEQEYAESGTLVRERRYAVVERGSELQVEQRWYLNGQPKEKTEYLQQDGKPVRRDTSYHDNGKVSSESLWTNARYDRQAIGVHTSYDADGHLRYERFHDAKGRLTRERETDASGQVVRDDALFEDGSRKAYAR